MIIGIPYLKRTFVLLLTFWAFCLQGISQDSQVTPSSAGDAITSLRKGTAVVRLYFNNPKVQKLRLLSQDSRYSEEERARFKKQLDEHLDERNLTKMKTILAFEKNYKFSKVLFMPDSLSYQLSNGVRKGIFFDQEGNLDPNLALTDDEFLLLVRGDADHLFEFRNLDNSPLPSSFPSKATFNVIDAFKLLSRSRINLYLQKLNNQLFEFHNRYTGRD